MRFSIPKSLVEGSDELMDFVISEEAADAAISVDGGCRTNCQGSLCDVSPSKSDTSVEAEADSSVRTSMLTKLIHDVKTLQSSKPNTAVKVRRGQPGCQHLEEHGITVQNEDQVGIGMGCVERFQVCSSSSPTQGSAYHRSCESSIEAKSPP